MGQLPAKPSQTVVDYRELGTLGLQAWGGYIRDEFLQMLNGLRGLKKFREMAENDDVCGAALYVIEHFARQVSWRVDTANETASDDEKNKAEFLEQCLFEDLNQPWPDVLSEILTMLVYGFAVLEIIYKKRVGPYETDPTRRSMFKDGQIGWRKFAPRAQETMHHWLWDDSGGIAGVVQIDPYLGAARVVDIPIEKMLLFRTTTKRNNPQGRSIFRSAFVDYEYKTRIKEFEGIGIERDLAGLPKLTAPDGVDLWNPNEPNAAAQFAICQKMVANIRNNTQAGVLLPFGWEFELVASAGTKQFNTNDIIGRYDQRIAMTVLADFMLIGHTQTGSRALAEPKQRGFSMAMTTFLDHICSIINRVAVPRLWKFNGWDLENMPQLKHGEVEPVDLVALSTFIMNLAKSGMALFPNGKLQASLLQSADLPVPDDDTMDEDEKPVPIVGPGAAVATPGASGTAEANGGEGPPEP